MTAFETVSTKLGVFCALVTITRIKSGNLVLPGERRYDIPAEEEAQPPYRKPDSLPPYIEVAAPIHPDICSSSGTSTEPTQQRDWEAGSEYELQLEIIPSLCIHRTSPPVHQADVTAPASCALPGTITRSSSHTNGPVPAVSLKCLVAFSRNLRCKLGICGKHSKCDCALARISSLSFERLEADEQSIVCALWTLTGAPGAYDAARIVQPIQIEITIN
ncbi:hypothetical protein R3P38DRAFT_3367677 [Favolaschia claudopus]|uniref:Uncharacterized protein n=1 Tax=Favolaschia claudopus TaxID=2862362 RepID=A0AAW0A8I6_9AGAR